MFNKLYTKILDSSIWLEPAPTRIVWITLLAAMDIDGYAHFSAVENLELMAMVSLDEAKPVIVGDERKNNERKAKREQKVS